MDWKHEKLRPSQRNQIFATIFPEVCIRDDLKTQKRLLTDFRMTFLHIQQED